MANLKTLKPFTKGYDSRRNTKGRPTSKWAPWRKAMERELKRKTRLIDGKPVTVEMEIIMSLIANARKGNLSAMKLYFDYRFGKPISRCPRCEYIATKQARAELRRQQEQEERKRNKAIEKEVDGWMKEWEKEK